MRNSTTTSVPVWPIVSALLQHSPLGDNIPESLDAQDVRFISMEGTQLCILIGKQNYRCIFIPFTGSVEPEGGCSAQNPLFIYQPSVTTCSECESDSFALELFAVWWRRE